MTRLLMGCTLVVLAGCTAGGRTPPGEEYWSALPSPDQATVSALGMGPTGVLFAGTGAGLFVSSDRGASWSLTTPVDWNVSSVLPATEAIVLVGTYRRGIRRSEDGGTTWSSVGFEENVYVDALAQDQSGRVFAAVAHSVDGAPTGIFRSDDAGVTWVSSGLASEHAYSVSVPIPGHVYAGTESGTYRSTDSGASWSAVAGLPSSAPLSALVTIGDALIAGFAEPRHRMPGTGAWVSIDAGETWNQMEGLAPETAVHSLVVAGDIVIAATGDVLGRGGSGIYIWSDDRTSWDPMGLGDQWLRPLIGTPEGELFTGGTESGVFAYDLGGPGWTPRSSGLRNWSPTALSIDAGGRLYALSVRSLRRLEREDNWSDVALPNGAAAPTPFSFSTLSDGTLLLPGEGGVIVGRIGAGQWERREVPAAGGPVLAVQVNGKDRVFVTFPEHGTFASADRGITWERIEAPLGTRGVSTSPTGALLAYGEGVSRRADGEAWEPTHLQASVVFEIKECEGALYLGSAPEGVLRSLDDGRSWSPLMDSLRNTAQQPGYIAVHSLQCLLGHGLLAATFSDGVFLLRPGGGWEDVTRGLPTRNVGDLALASSGIAYLATAVGVYRSTVSTLGGKPR